MSDPLDRWFWIHFALAYVLMGLAELRRGYVGWKVGATIIRSIADQDQLNRDRMSYRSQMTSIWFGTAMILLGVFGIYYVLHRWR